MFRTYGCVDYSIGRGGRVAHRSCLSRVPKYNEALLDGYLDLTLDEYPIRPAMDPGIML